MDMVSADSLVDILGRLPPRSLASCRRVCRAWRATVDDHSMLPRASQLPLSLDGVIFETTDLIPPTLFSRRSTARETAIGCEYIDDNPCEKNWYWYWSIYDCCNGLLLLYEHVVNPATRQWARLPTPPYSCTARYLAYDPTISPHYEVLFIPEVPILLPAGHISEHTLGHEWASRMEWPPSTYIIHVFSSETGRWKERSLVREGDAIRTVADLEEASKCVNYLYYSAYWKGAIYARFECGFVLRISLYDDKYAVIKLPKGNKGQPRLGKSKKGVYCALLHQRHTCEIWYLDESRGHMEWELRTEVNLQSIHTNYLSVHGEVGPWIQQRHGKKEGLSINDIKLKLVEDTKEPLPKDDFEWDSNNGNNVSVADLSRESDGYTPYFECLGFHPYKEIILLHWSCETIAYHFDSSKVRYLGRMMPHSGIEVSFAYAPSWIGGLPGSA